MNLQYINFLVQLKNNAAVGTNTVSLSYNSRMLPLIKFLYNEGILESFFIKANVVCINLRLFNGRNPFKELRIISTISYKKFLTYTQMTKINESKFLFVLSTDKGLLSLSQCKELGIGGKVLFIF